MPAKTIIIWVIVIVGVAGLMVGLAYLGTRQTAPVEALLAIPVSPSDLQKGGANANATLVEYGDFQCPACAQYFPIVEKIVSEYGDKINFVYRHFPLRQIHPNAQAAAQASQAAAEQGKFWDYYALLYNYQDDWAKLANPDEKFTFFANALKLDMTKFEADKKSDATIKKIQSDLDGANASKVSSTPTFFLNGKLIKAPANYELFKQLIDDEIAR